MGATEIATVFLDRELKIRRFTPAARKVIRLIDSDVGRSLDDIATTLQYEGFSEDVHSVLETLNRVEREVVLGGGAWYEMKIFPYRTAQDVIDGVVVTFVDISLQKKSTAAAEQAADFAEAIVETVREPLLILDRDLKVIEANPAFYRHFRTDAAATIGVQVYELGSNQWDIPELRTLLEQIVPQNTKFEGFRVQAGFPKIGVRTMLLNARQTMHRGEATGRILLAFEDISDRQQDE
jgi:two-component system CheB/CheR fusion protein